MGNILQSDISKKIHKIFLDLVSIKSDTGTELERIIEDFLYRWLGNLEYFRKNPELFGKYELENDSIERSIIWGVIKGKGDKTVILVHHHDVVDSFDFGLLSRYAYEPDKLHDILIQKDISAEVKKDLESNEWIFGRGTCDMKAGAAIQLALIEKYSKVKDLAGNIILLSVPDEESLSAGMRNSIGLLYDLRGKFNFDYTMCIDAESHQRDFDDKGILYEGTAGKLLPVIYVRGKKTHIGSIFEGFNPVVLLSEIVRNTELNTDFCDVVMDEVSIPPSWSFFRDRKKCYDASIPSSAGGYLSIITFTRTPKEIIGQLKKICMNSFESVIKSMNQSYLEYSKKSRLGIQKLPWKSNVVTFSELYQEAVAVSGDKFIEDYKRIIKEVNNDIQDNKINASEATFQVIEKTLGYVQNLSPIVVIGLSPPYYPHLCNRDFEKLPKNIFNLSNEIIRFTKETWNEGYKKKNYFLGLSDMSYVALHNSEEVIPFIGPNMPLMGDMYFLPFEKMEELNIPVINIGPWGKDLHKFTERVFKRDLYIRTPQIMEYAINYSLR